MSKRPARPGLRSGGRPSQEDRVVGSVEEAGAARLAQRGARGRGAVPWRGRRERCELGCVREREAEWWQGVSTCGEWEREERHEGECERDAERRAHHLQGGSGEPL